LVFLNLSSPFEGVEAGSFNCLLVQHVPPIGHSVREKISNQIKFICDTKIRMPMKEVQQKVMCQQDTQAAKSCTNRCPNRKKLKQYKNNGYLLK